jgi:hypothetical protein
MTVDGVLGRQSTIVGRMTLIYPADEERKARDDGTPLMIAASGGHSDAVQALRRAEALVASGAVEQAVALAVAANRISRSAELERLLVLWRSQALSAEGYAPGYPHWPRDFPDPFPGIVGLPKIAADALTPAVLGGAILHHGALWVTGLIQPDEAERLRRDVERVFTARDAFHAGAPVEETNPLYARLPMTNALALSRQWNEEKGGVLTADSPRMLFDLIELFDRQGLLEMFARYFGERPVLSVGKSTLRRIPPTSDTDWHQDGAFLGKGVRTVNVWLALSPCGDDAPGLDVVGRRIPYVVQTGSHGSLFDWSVGPGMVDLLVEGGAPIVSPRFAAGDAMLFDQLNLHRTGVRPGMTKCRWAIESWFFTPSAYPVEQVPLLI